MGGSFRNALWPSLREDACRASYGPPLEQERCAACRIALGYGIRSSLSGFVQVAIDLPVVVSKYGTLQMSNLLSRGVGRSARL